MFSKIKCICYTNCNILFDYSVMRQCDVVENICKKNCL